MTLRRQAFAWSCLDQNCPGRWFASLAGLKSKEHAKDYGADRGAALALKARLLFRPRTVVVSVPLHLDTLPGKPSATDLHAALVKRYAGSACVSVMPLQNEAAKSGRLEPEALNETNRIELYVFASEKHRQAVLVARLDNLGKGASGAAVQNMRLMLGLPDK